MPAPAIDATVAVGQPALKLCDGPQLAWHPDKFERAFGARLAAARDERDAQRVRDRANETARLLNALRASLKGGGGGSSGGDG